VLLFLFLFMLLCNLCGVWSVSGTLRSSALFVQLLAHSPWLLLSLVLPCADLLPWLRETAPVVQDMLPGVLTSGTRFLAMLAQRQALRLADDLDGGKSVEEWDLDPYAFARTIQPQRATRTRKQQ